MRTMGAGSVNEGQSFSIVGSRYGVVDIGVPQSGHFQGPNSIRLFEATCNREYPASNFWVENREDGHWRISFARLLLAEETGDSERLAALLHWRRLNVEVPDSPMWLPTSDGSFSVKGCYGWWRRNREPLPWASMAKEMWIPKVPLKVRHAQGIHNVEGEKDHKAYLSPALFDAHLTPLGWEQVESLRKHVHACGLAKRIDLGVHPCDKRRSISEYQQIFPAIDFSLIENDEDVLWTADKREANEHVAARGTKFINWLWTRKEKEIAIVTHSGFLYHTLKKIANDCNPLIKEEISTHFHNCELRSMVLIDESIIGSDASITNYPGQIPNGPDLPSDIAHEKHPNNGKQTSK
ncbi:hypothetical protein QJS04_geneDACA001494 [Acorus gramineus]|uniref:Phosphoglycerate mutase-like protein n=1 Tax=Acorus gramineus TaxID=55184 RepID=A0AAV9BIY2_ACOGR|nr:hypothetical protein QJS04_geneDACA001494 [Acorus gramineus]